MVFGGQIRVYKAKLEQIITWPNFIFELGPIMARYDFL